jgi:trigger factor
MQVHVEHISPVRKRLTIEIPAERVNEEIDRVYAGIQKKAKLQGFRPGKAPMQLIRRTYSSTMQDEVMRRFYDQTLFKALDEHKIEPVNSPAIENSVLEPGSAFRYTALVEVLPEVVVKDYTGLRVQKEKFAPSPESIEEELKRMQENMAHLTPVPEGTSIADGHVVSLDYSFTVDGFPEESSSATDLEVEVGSNRLIAGFDEQLIGLACGDSREIRVTLPEGYRNSAVAGKEGVFLVTIKEIKQKELPELDDEFAAQFGEYDSIGQLREKMAEYREKHEKERIESDLKERLIKALIERNPLEVPDALVNRQLEHMLQNFKNRLKRQNFSLEMMGLDDRGFRARFRNDAADKVRGGLLLMSLVEKENITVDDDDLTKRYEQIATGNPDMLARVREYYESNRTAKQSLIAEIKEDKAVELLLASAIVTEVDASELKAAA